MRLLLLWTLALQLMAIEWEASYTRAKEKAAQQNKPIFFLLSQRQCGWCDYYQEHTLRDPQLSEYLEKHFICLKLYSEDEAYPPALTADASPATWFLDTKGKPMFQASYGALKVKALKRYLHAVEVKFAGN